MGQSLGKGVVRISHYKQNTHQIPSSGLTKCETLPTVSTLLLLPPDSHASKAPARQENAGSSLTAGRVAELAEWGWTLVSQSRLSHVKDLKKPTHVPKRANTWTCAPQRVSTVTCVTAEKQQKQWKKQRTVNPSHAVSHLQNKRKWVSQKKEGGNLEPAHSEVKELPSAPAHQAHGS